MCGIAGGILRCADTVPEGELQRRGAAMTEILHHRGPDGYGVWSDGQAVLAHTRLAIIDISNAAAQPMHDENSTVLRSDWEVVEIRSGRVDGESARLSSTRQLQVRHGGEKHNGNERNSEP